MSNLVNPLDRNNFAKIKKEVPFLKDAWVLFWGDVPGDFQEQMEKKEKEMGEDYLFWVLAEVVADWNFSDGEKKLEITAENMKKLSLKLRNWISNANTSIMQQESESFSKKKEK